MKKRLLTPGPSPVPEDTLLELAKPVFFHRSKEFRDILAEVHADLQYLYCTRNPVIPLTCSGTGGLEAALVNSVPPGGKVLCLIAGRFGERWRKICQAHGFEAIAVTVPPGESVSPDQLQQALRDHPDVVCVCSTLSETSTGAAHDIRAFGAIVAKTDALLLVDAISGLGVMECRTDDWHVDICVTGSQKALMLPPGLAFVSVGDKAWRRIEANTSRRAFYFDLVKARDKLASNDTPYTPAHTLIRALRISLKQLRQTGLENLWRYHATNAAAARAGFSAIGLELFARQPANGLTVAKAPEGFSSTDILDRLEKHYGLKLANGQDDLKGKILRLAHMGYIDQFDILAALSGVELVLGEMGFPLSPGAGVAAAQRIYAEAAKEDR